ncbi:hypothetical protein [Arthrobacter sp. MMS18-M83]|uniref:hypothetical protein n=1 Tax=Arthrobacter sp. MMS18-M83 TaxID=2996261 RepID=UPI00227C443D|nr:hypothetical protein [Arthrobacter sp. MMS18-M83]WAH99723.1 hypothetical protein OW521_01115 [Arthrobacter sp. MMS18-M83]
MATSHEMGVAPAWRIATFNEHARACADSTSSVDAEPLLRNGATLELDGRRPVPELTDEVERLIAAADQI